MTMELRKPVRTLIVEDSEDDALLILRELKRGGFEPAYLRVDSADAFRRALATGGWEIILCDYKMPGFSGAEALKLARSQSPDIPFLIISGTIGEELAVAMMKAGAHDFLLKDALGRLVPAVERELREAEIRRERDSQQAALRESEAAYHTLFDASTDGILLIGLDGSFVDASRAAYERLGYTKSELLDMHIGQLVHADFKMLVPVRLKELQERGASVFESAYLRKDGSSMPVEVSSRLIDHQGKQVFFSIVRDITERKKAEALLRNTNETLNALIRYSPLAIICTDREGRITVWNSAAEQIFGWSESEVLGGKNPIVPGHKEEEYRRLQERVLSGSPYHARELQRQRKDGSLIYLQASSSAVYAENGDVIALIGIFEDITDRKAATEALLARERQLAESQRMAHIGSWEHNLTTGDVNWSDELFRLVGLDPAKDPGDFKRFVEMIHPDDRPRLKSAIERTVATGEHFSVDYRIVLDDGTTRTLHAQAELKHDPTGTQNILSGTAQDITERKRAEEQLRRSEEYVRSILDSVDEGFIVVDRNYRILTANRAYCAQAHRSVESVVGRKCFEVSHGLARPCSESGEDCAVRRVFESGEPQVAVHSHGNGDGEVLFAETKAYPLRNGSGEITSVIETVTNITEKHLLEEERLKTQKLEAIGTLAGGIAHDFNNLLQGVFGYISMAKSTLDEPDRSLAMLEQAEKALGLSVSLTSQLLTFSKGGKPVKRRLDLRSVVENAVKFALSGSRLDSRIELDRDLRPVEADEGQIAQVIQNIVLNANQAMPRGGEIEITGKNREAPAPGVPQVLEPGRYVAIAVRDRGTGIPASALARIFDPYFTTKEKGSGLGLATSYSIIKNHGGQIEVQSEIGQGSCFTIYLPAADDAGVEMRAAPAPAAVRCGRVLVMDDEEIVRMVSGELIRILGHDTDFAEHGAVAVEKYRQAREAGAPYDIVILDLTVRGGMGGLETLRKLREIDPDVKAVVSSGYSDDEIVAQHVQYGFRSFLRKPYDLEALRSTLHALLV